MDGHSESWLFDETARNPDRLRLRPLAPSTNSQASTGVLELAPTEFVSLSHRREFRWQGVVLGATIGALAAAVFVKEVPGEFPLSPAGAALAAGMLGGLVGFIWTFPGTKTVRCDPEPRAGDR
ncbi:MAG: hypothetical protein ACREOU_01645 [Candidatus Eiseniibacteriota bacterium]